MTDPFISRRLGRYEIQQEIGRGGMARVYQATDTLLKRTVALKVLAPQLGNDAEFARRFEREAVTAANLRHPGIITIFDVGEAEGLPYIAMEFVDGCTLATAIGEHGSLSLPLTIAVLTPVAEALDYAHDQGAVHRDVKPHNILIGRDGRVLLTDFGIALGPQAGGERLTQAGSFMGTPEYLSPEQVQAQPVTGASDRYTLGIVAFEALTGKIPFEGTTPQLIVAHAYTPPPAITDVDPALPRDLNMVFVRALAKQSVSRFGRATDFIVALQNVATQWNMPPARRAEIVALAQPGPSSAGQPTIAISAPPLPQQTPPTPPADGNQAIKSVFGQQKPPARDAIEDVFGAQKSTPPRAARPATPAAPRTPATPAQRPRQPPRGSGTPPRQARQPDLVYPRGEDPDARLPPGAVGRVQPIYRDNQRMNIPWGAAIVGVLGVVVVVLILLQPERRSNGANGQSGLGAVFAEVTPTPVTGAATDAAPTDLQGGAAPTPIPTGLPPATEPPPAATQPSEPPPATEPAPTELQAPPTVAPAVPTPEPPTSVPLAPTVTLEPTPTATLEPTPEPTSPPAPTATPQGGPTPIGGGAAIVFHLDDGIDLFDMGSRSEASIRTDAEPIGPAAISPDGATILFDAVEDGQRQIFQYSRASGRVDRYTQSPGDAYHPAWSPDGQQVLYAGATDDNSELYVIESEGIRRLTNDPAQDDYPSWTPDGRQIVWESTRTGSWGVYIMNQDGFQRLVPAVDGADDRYPRVSPDGSQVVFASNRDRTDGGFEIYVQSLGGGSPVRITTFGNGNALGPQWSPDGQMILFFTNTNGTNDLYAVRLNDGVVSPIRNSSANERWPAWGP